MILKKYGYLFFLTKKLFTSTNRFTLTSIILKLSSISITLAIAILITVISIMNGFESEFKERILNLVPHSSIIFNDPDFTWQDTLKKIEINPYVIRAEPHIKLDAFMSINGALQPLILKGVNLFENQNYLSQYLYNKKDKDIEKNEIIISTKVSKDFDLKIGEAIDIYIPDNNNQQDFFSGIKIKNFIISNTFDTGTEVDNHLSLISLSEAMTMNNQDDAIQQIHIQYSDIFKSRYYSSLITSEIGKIARISDWSQKYGGLYHTIKLSSDLVLLILGSIIIVSAFNLYVSMNMIVKHKSKHISILKTLGLNNKLLLIIFISKGASITFISIIIGTILGLILATSIPLIFNHIETILGLSFLSIDIYPLDYLPSKIIYSDIFLINSLTFFIAIFSTIAPAIKASKINPSINLSHT